MIIQSTVISEYLPEPDYGESDSDYTRKIDKDIVGIGLVAFTIGHTRRVYGGPEEGGWWYDSFDPERVILAPKRAGSRLQARLEKLVEARNLGLPRLSSVLSSGQYTLYEGIEERTQPQRYE